MRLEGEMSEAPKRVWLVPDDSDCSDPAWNEATQYAIDSGKAKLFLSAAALREAIDRNATAHDIVDAIEKLLEGE